MIAKISFVLGILTSFLLYPLFFGEINDILSMLAMVAFSGVFIGVYCLIPIFEDKTALGELNGK